MGWIVVALLPGFVLFALLLDIMLLANAALAVVTALLAEAACLRAGGRAVVAGLSDLSITVTALLIALALPPATPGYIVVVAVLCAVTIGKHVFGGLGQNIFNPALVGYTIVLVSFPAALSDWPLDAHTGATALTDIKYRDGQTLAEFSASQPAYPASAWLWLNITFAAGGVLLLVKRFAAWRVPAAMLATLAALAALTYDQGGSGSFGSPLFHLTTGSTMLAAFFVATDPVTHPTDARGQVLFGSIAGAVTFLIRAEGSYPDGIAFGILLANACTPLLRRLHTNTLARARTVTRDG